METRLVSVVKEEHLDLLRGAIYQSEGLLTDVDVMDSLADGSFAIWETVEDDRILGCFITEVIETARGVDINVPLAGYKQNFSALNSAMKYLIEATKQAGFDSLRFISSDKRFGSFAKRRGFRRRFIEYVQDFK